MATSTLMGTLDSTFHTDLTKLYDVAEPVADSNEAMIAVTAFSLNRGELRRAEAAPSRRGSAGA